MTRCKGCGRKILWGVNLEGKKIPLDPSAPVYEITEDEGVIVIVRTKTAMVSHFSTCPKATLFSGGK